MPLIESISDTKHQKEVSKYVLSGPAGTITEGLKWSELWGFFFLLLRWAFFKSLHLCAETRKGTLITTQSRSAASVAEWKALNLTLFFCSWSSSLQTGCCSERSLRGQSRSLLHMVLSPEQSDERLNDKPKSCTVCLQTHKVHNMCNLNMEFIDPTAFSCSAVSICLDSTVWFNWALGGLQKRIIYYYLSYRNYEK